VPCNRMPKKQARIRAAGDTVLVEGVPPRERMRVLLEAMIRRKEARCSRSRCARCWFPTDSSGTSYCVCARMPPLAFATKTRFLVYMHPRDWYNAGDDAKILLNAAPDATELFVFGRPGDDARLRGALEAAEAAVLLFPDEAALTVEEFRERWRGRSDVVTPAVDGQIAAAATRAAPDPALAIVVIDGTWNNVKQVMKHFNREVGPQTPHVRLQPTALSVYARTQTRADGVSSLEAIALLLRELGEAEETCAELVRYLEINNEALRFQLLPGDENEDEDEAPPPQACSDNGELRAL